MARPMSREAPVTIAIFSFRSVIAAPIYSPTLLISSLRTGLPWINASTAPSAHSFVLWLLCGLRSRYFMARAVAGEQGTRAGFGSDRNTSSAHSPSRTEKDRKSVVEGKGVDLGRRRIIK